MKIALIGYGKMGHIIEQIALQRGHSIVAVIDKDNVEDIHSAAFRSADVAIEFTTPATAESNIRAAWEENVPVVCGTTGWTAPFLFPHEGERCPEYEHNILFWSSNFSIGVNLFFQLNKQLAALMQPYEQYKPVITEIHHIHKLDAPSGTAVTLREGIRDARCLMLDTCGLKVGKIGTVGQWDKGTREVPIESIREGEVPGTHIVEWDSAVDKITITHEAKSREGFALGAVIAAEFVTKQKQAGSYGFYTMEDLINV